MDELFHYRSICKVIVPHSVLLIGSDWSLLEGGAFFFLEGGAFFWIWHLSAPQGNPACTLSHLDLSFGLFTELTCPCTNLCNADCTFWLIISRDPGYRYSGCSLGSKSLDKTLWSWCCYRGKWFKIMAEPNFRLVPSHTGWAVEPTSSCGRTSQPPESTLIGSLTRRENRIKWSQFNSQLGISCTFVIL